MGGKDQPSNRPNIDYTNYEEGIYVGYRYFDSFNKAVSYPFGYGESYTTFNYAGLKVEPQSNGYRVRCVITNHGDVAGKEVVQLYIAAPGKQIDKPAKELRGFAKTALLQPGKSEEVIFTFTDADLASFDEIASQWVTEAGRYEVLIGSSAADIRLRGTLERSQQTVIEKVHAVLTPQQHINVLKP